MKRKACVFQLIILLFGILFINTLKAQSYEPLVKEGASWIIKRTIDGGWPQLVSVGQYTLSGDSVFQGITYKKLYGTAVDSPVNLGLSRVEALMREDSNRQVFIVHADSSNGFQFGCHDTDSASEHLLYDFDLGLGDTLYYPTSMGDTNAYFIEKIDTVTISGIKRTRWHFNWNSTNDQWIEGIGSTSGIYFPYCFVFETGWELTCYFDDKILYRKDTTRSCKFLSINENKPINRTSYFPNPTNGKLFIDLGETNSNVHVKVYNVLGNKVEEKSFKKRDSFDLDITGPSGIYYVVIQSTETRQTIKVLKEKD